MNPIGSNICVAIAATMYCVEEELKFTIRFQCMWLLCNNVLRGRRIKIYNTFSVYVVAMQQLDNFNSTILKNMYYNSLCM